jgi:uncharacterized protein (DUF983 family)
MDADGSAHRLPVRPGLATMMFRGALRRCPWCGDRRAYFTGWFAKQESCRRCNAPWRRADVGFELGAATVNIMVTLGLIVVGVTTGMVLTAPDFAVLPIVVGLVIAALVVPVLVYPMSYTLWQALDLVMRPPEPGEMPSPPVTRRNA